MLCFDFHIQIVGHGYLDNKNIVLNSEITISCAHATQMGNSDCYCSLIGPNFVPWWWVSSST